MNQTQYNLTLHFMASEPVAFARKLELVNSEHAASIIKSAPISSAVNVLKSMLPSVSAKLFYYFTDEQCLKLTENMEVADLAAMLRHVDKDKRSATIKLLSLHKQTLCKMLVTYPEYTIGSMVEMDVLIVDSHMLVADIIIRLKKRSYSYLQCLYVVSQSRILLGKVFIGDLLRAESKSKIAALITAPEEVVSAFCDMSEAIKWDIWNHTDTLPVVNKSKEFMGIIHYNRLRHSISVRQAYHTKSESISSELLDIYADTVVNMIDLVQPLDKHS